LAAISEDPGSKPLTGAATSPPRESAGSPPTCGLGPSEFARLRLWESNALAKEVHVALLIILALIVALFVGLGFVVKWLFILAVVAALIWVIAFFMRGART
jgi:hypothetical protein